MSERRKNRTGRRWATELGLGEYWGMLAPWQRRAVAKAIKCPKLADARAAAARAETRSVRAAARAKEAEEAIDVIAQAASALKELRAVLKRRPPVESRR